MGTQALPQKGGGAPQIFGPFLLWPNGMPLGMDVGLSPVDFVLDGDPVPSPKKQYSWPVSGNLPASYPALITLVTMQDSSVIKGTYHSQWSRLSLDKLLRVQRETDFLHWQLDSN